MSTSRALLIGAVLATPLWVALWAVQAFTRDGFRPTYHPISLLSLGEGGWLQVLNFVIVGLLISGGGIGLGRALGVGRLTQWISILVVMMGFGLAISGLFVTDAGGGFPAGAPEGAPVMSWHGAVHEAGFILTQLAFLAAGITLAILFARNRRRAWMWACIAAVAAAMLVPAVGALEALAIRLFISSVIELGLISAIAFGLLLGRVADGASGSTATIPYAEPHGSTSRTR